MIRIHRRLLRLAAIAVLIAPLPTQVNGQPGRAANSPTSLAARSSTPETRSPVLRQGPLVQRKGGADYALAARFASRSDLSLAQYLEAVLGERQFHRRSNWAGRAGRYAPVRGGGRVWKPLGPVRHLTIHHSEGVPNEHPARMIRTIYKSHISPGGRLKAADVGYHFFVDRNGEVWEGRDARMLGTHVGSTPDGLNNRGNLGICGLGTFKRERPTRAMRRAIAELSALIACYYDRRLEVRGHRDWIGANRFRPKGGVDCPGRLQSAVDKARKEVRVALERKKEFDTAAGRQPPHKKSQAKALKALVPAGEAGR